MKTEPRVAFFPDSYVEVNGVAHTSRQLTSYARENKLPLLCVHGTPNETQQSERGSVTELALHRTKFGFALDADLRSDLLFWRHFKRVEQTVRDFKADVVHITGPNDTGQLGALVAWQLGLPLVISWHTNVHEYAKQRLGLALPFLPASLRQGLGRQAEALSLRAVLRFYQTGRVLLAPNETLRAMLSLATRKATFLMERGVNLELFKPSRRIRHDTIFQIGYVGRLTPEKNVRVLVELERALLAQGLSNFRFVIVGAGSERAWLEQNLQHAHFTGVLKGDALASAYANFDLFVFPSTTDTFGNVVLEAQACGVPALVSAHGGPRFIIEPETTGLIADGVTQLANATAALMSDRARLARMAEAARQRAATFSWEQVFARVYEAYEHCLHTIHAERRTTVERPIVSTSEIAAG